MSLLRGEGRGDGLDGRGRCGSVGDGVVGLLRTRSSGRSGSGGGRATIVGAVSVVEACPSVVRQLLFRSRRGREEYPPFDFISLPILPSLTSSTRLPNAASGRFLLVRRRQLPSSSSEKEATTHQFQQFFHPASSMSCPPPAAGGAETRLATARALASNCLWFSLSTITCVRQLLPPFLNLASLKLRRNSLHHRLHLLPHRFPNLPKALLGAFQFGPKSVNIMLHGELIVGHSIAEVQAGREGEVGFERKGELGEETLAAGRGVRDEQSRFGGVVDLFSMPITFESSRVESAIFPSFPSLSSAPPETQAKERERTDSPSARYRPTRQSAAR